MTTVNENIERRLQRIEDQLEKIQKILQKLQTSCSGMDEHINFVEGVYDVLKSPLNLTLSAFRPLFGSTEALPEFREDLAVENVD